MKNSKQPKILVLAALMLASTPFVAASPLAGVADSAAATFVNSAQAAAVNSVTSQAVRDISAAAAKDVRVNGITDCVMPPVKGLEPWRANLGDAIKIKIDTAAEKQFAERLNGISTNQPYTTTLPDGTTVIVPNPGPGGCVVPPVPNPGSDPRRHVGDLSARATENAAIARESIDAASSTTYPPYTTTLPDGTVIEIPNPGPGGCVMPPVPNPNGNGKVRPGYVGDKVNGEALNGGALTRLGDEPTGGNDNPGDNPGNNPGNGGLTTVDHEYHGHYTGVDATKMNGEALNGGALTRLGDEPTGGNDNPGDNPGNNPGNGGLTTVDHEYHGHYTGVDATKMNGEALNGGALTRLGDDTIDGNGSNNGSQNTNSGINGEDQRMLKDVINDEVDLSEGEASTGYAYDDSADGELERKPVRKNVDGSITIVKKFRLLK